MTAQPSFLSLNVRGHEGEGARMGGVGRDDSLGIKYGKLLSSKWNTSLISKIREARCAKLCATEMLGTEEPVQ